MCWAACDRLAKIARPNSGWNRSAPAISGARAADSHAREQILRTRLGSGTRKHSPRAFGRPGDGCQPSDAMPMISAFMPRRAIHAFHVSHGGVPSGRHLLPRQCTCSVIVAADDFGEPEERLQYLHILVYRCTGEHRPHATKHGNCSRTCSVAQEPARACCRKISTRTANELWGNFPQTYSMAGIINAARAPEPRPGRRRSNRAMPI